MKPTLLVLAAGMGSRYGSLKQMDGIGPNKEAIIDYSVYDAIRAGFGKVVFVIRSSFGAEFKEVFSAERFGGKIQVEYVFQELNSGLPVGYAVPEGREKPWGTNHALMMGGAVIGEPFAVINADDFYGQDAIAQMGAYLAALPEGSEGEYAMVGYEVCKTLSENGTVSRGVCTIDGKGYLESIVERTKIVRQPLDEGGNIVYIDDDGSRHPLAENTPVSMNLFGFTPDYFRHSTEFFRKFLDDALQSGNLKAEFFIPLLVNKLVSERVAKLKVLHTTSDWFGVTYKEDRPATVQRVLDLIEAGVYPRNLWGK
ncbi:nucleotidyltransferase [uncultured Rikenella sp.]|uniref:nucleotidyltransferase family protein n=1 Tax=uncultured Rikenella sp. TaxID=368003 RepID=UPI00260309CD|nr:nucleotidyltransferase [uncultured Rikenella sp.]